MSSGDKNVELLQGTAVQAERWRRLAGVVGKLLLETERLRMFCVASELRERATRTERAGAAARERACRGVRGAKPLGEN